MNIPQPVNIVTASLTPGDAIGNYILTLQRLLKAQGIAANLYADHIHPGYGAPAHQASGYHPGGSLWYHYSIYAENVSLVSAEADLKIIDYHGVSPPHLFEGYDAHLARLCRRGLEALPSRSETFDLSIVHSEYTRAELLGLGFRNVQKLPLVVDTSRFSGSEDAELSRWLKLVPYLLFVGRIVPQKDILSMLSVFERFHRLQPDAVLILAGGRHLAARYQKEIDRDVKRYNLEDHVLMTGQINSAAMLTSLYRHARFTLITSEWESFCVPIVESMTFGTPLIVHDVPPLPEVMGNAGVVIDKHNPDQAAAEIDRLWRDKTAYAALVDACRRRADAYTEAALNRHLLSLFSGTRSSD